MEGLILPQIYAKYESLDPAEIRQLGRVVAEIIGQILDEYHGQGLDKISDESPDLDGWRPLAESKLKASLAETATNAALTIFNTHAQAKIVQEFGKEDDEDQDE